MEEGGQRKRCGDGSGVRDAGLWALKMDEAATSEGMWVACRSRKGKAMDSFLELPERTQPVLTPWL